MIFGKRSGLQQPERLRAQPDAIFYSSGAGRHAVHPQLADRSLTKPSPALLHRACDLLNLNPHHAWMVGDRIADLEAAVNFGARPVLVRSGFGRHTEADTAPLPEGSQTVEDLTDAVELILTACDKTSGNGTGPAQ